MAYKAHGVADVVRTVNGIDQRSPGTVTDNGGRAFVTVGDHSYGPKTKTYPGNPPAEALDANNVDVRTLAGRPWPGSAADRLAKSPPDKAPRVAKDGTPIRLNGPNSMAEAERLGLWPDDEERKLQEFVETKLANPVGVGMAMLKAQGMTEEQARARVMARTHDRIPDVSHLRPAAGKKG